MGPLPQTPAQVGEWIPHRAPMLLIDKVLSADANSLTASRLFRAEEFFFQGHFPDHPILPGVIVLEALAQTAALHTSLSKGLRATQVAYRFSKVAELVWQAPVLPGQEVTLTVIKQREKLGFLQFTATAKVAEVLVCEANFTAKVLPR
jgi:3-hydroxyacyl-[acyl-carrier-protein] dehydratase